MKKTALLSIMLLLVSYLVTAQGKYEIGVEGGITMDKYKIKDANNNLGNVPCVSGIGGINFRINNRKNFFYEMALLKKEYTDGLKMKQEDGYTVTNSDEVILLPLRLGYYFPLSKHFTIVPAIGIVPAYKTLDQQGVSSSQYTPNTVWSTGYTYTTRAMRSDFYSLAQGGLSLECKCFKRIKLSFATNYYQGLSKIAIYDIKYKIDNGPIQQAWMYGKGSFINYNFGIKYLLPEKL